MFSTPLEIVTRRVGVSWHNRALFSLCWETWYDCQLVITI